MTFYLKLYNTTNKYSSDSDYFDFNDGINTSLSLESLDTGTNEFNKDAIYLYNPVDGKISFQIKGSPESIYSKIRYLQRILYTYEETTKNDTNYQPLFLEASGIYSSGIYRAELLECSIELPSDYIHRVINIGLVDVVFSFKRKTFNKVSDYSNYVSSLKSLQAGGITTIPSAFVVSGTSNIYNFSPVTFTLYPFSHDLQRYTPSGFLIISSNIYDLSLADMSSGASFGFSQVTNATALNGSYVSKTLNAGESITYSGNTSDGLLGNTLFGNTNSADSVAVYAAIRCTGSWKFKSGLLQRASSNTPSFNIPLDRVFSEDMYYSNITTPQVVYAGTISAPKRLYGNPCFSITCLSSGTFDIDYLAFVGNSASSSYVVELLPIDTLIAGSGTIAIVNRPGAYLNNDIIGNSPKCMYLQVNRTTPTYGLAALSNYRASFPIQYRGSANITYKDDYFSSFFGPSLVGVLFLATGSGGAWSYRKNDQTAYTISGEFSTIESLTGIPL